MKSCRLILPGSVIAAASVLGFVLPGTAAAAGGTWNCTSSAVRLSLAGTLATEPFIANDGASTCATDSEGVATLTGLVGAKAVNASTAVDAAAAPASQTPNASATVANVAVPGVAPLISLPGTIASSATGSCVAGEPVITDTYSTVPIVIDGQTIPTDKTITALPLTGIGTYLGDTISIIPGEVLTSSSSLTVRALHVTISLPSVLGLLGTQVLDLVLSESTISYTGNPCTNATVGTGGNPGGTGGTGTGTGGTGGGGSGTGGGGSGSGSGSGGSGSGSGSGASASISKLELYNFLHNFDQFGFRIQATRTVNGGKWTRIRMLCSPKETHGCHAKVVVYRRIRGVPTKIGTRGVALKKNTWKIFSVRTKKNRHWPVYAVVIK